MEIIENVLITERVFPKVALTIGSFDGVHLGHQRILSEVVAAARERDGTAAAMTMRPHPRQVFSPHHPLNLLTAEKKKLDLFALAGLDVVYILPFSLEVAGMAPREFAVDVISKRCHAEMLIVGHDFHFGYRALGDYEFLTEIAPELGMTVRQTPPLIVEGERVSSTVIRERLLEGDLDEVEAFLGRKYSIIGEVVSGRGIGAQLGFPTANIRPFHTAVPAQGVYAAKVRLGNQTCSAAVNIGIAPTIQHDDIVIEAHLLDFNEAIRGREIEVVFYKRLRPEKKFNSHAELIAAIARDVDAIRAFFHEE